MTKLSDELQLETQKLCNTLGVDYPTAAGMLLERRPDLRFRLAMEPTHTKANFQNEAAMGGHQSRAAESPTDRTARRLRNSEIARKGWDEVNTLARVKGITQDAALEEVKKRNPEFANAISGSPIPLDLGGTAASRGDGTYPPPLGARKPGDGPSMKPTDAPKNANGVLQSDLERLGLPVDASIAERDMAAAVGSADFIKIFAAMAAAQARNENVSLDVARAYCVGRFPKLAHAAMAAGTIPKIKSFSSQGSSYDPTK